MAEKILISWSSGKDGAWLLHVLREDPRWDPAGLITTVDESTDRAAAHGIRIELLAAQADAAGLPMRVVDIPQPCPNSLYEERLAPVWRDAVAAGVGAVAFGDLFLADIRRYREEQLAGTGLEAVFPLWGEPTGALAERMIAAGLRAVVTRVDREQLDPGFLGRSFDHDLLRDLPEGIDPCAERGEFHTFATAGPMFAGPIRVRPGEREGDGRFVTLDLELGS